MEMSKERSSYYHEDTELRLGLPGSNNNNKRRASDAGDESTSGLDEILPPRKVQAIGWPPIRSYRKNNSIQSSKTSILLVKVSMDGAPYLRKIDLALYNAYNELINALEDMFNFKACKSASSKETQNKDGTECEITYEDKDGDWMLVGDVPWEMFTTSCKRLRIIKGSDVKGLGYMA